MSSAEAESDDERDAHFDELEDILFLIVQKVMDDMIEEVVCVKRACSIR